MLGNALQATIFAFCLFQQPTLPQHPNVLPRQPVVLVEQKTKVNIIDSVADIQVQQIFVNQTARDQEIIFVFPLPAQTSVNNLSLTIDGKAISSEILDKDKALQIYEDIVRQRRDPALLQYVGQGCIQARIFPVPANKTSTLGLRFSSVLPASNGLTDFVFPLVIAKELSTAQRPLAISLDLELESSVPLKTIYSPSHRIDIVQNGDHRAHISLEGHREQCTQNFRLLFGSSQKEFGLHYLIAPQANNSGHFLLFLAPKRTLAEARVQAKDLVFVLDTSGSMQGEKLQQAKDAIKFCLQNLNPDDRFNIVTFATESSLFREQLIAAEKNNLDAAADFIDSIKAVGGTNINEALQRALQLPKEASRFAMLIFLTDGIPTVGTTDVDQIFSNVRSTNSKATRIFTFGVGHDVNTRLLDTLAEETRATRNYVQPGEDLEIAVSTLYEQIAYPVLTDVQISADHLELFEVFPKQLADLFKGSQIIVAGRYRQGKTGSIRLRGKFNGENREWQYPVDFTAQETNNDFIAGIWANRKVGYLLDQIRLHGSNQELIDEIKLLGKQYGLLTPYTSHLVIEETMRVSQMIAPSQGSIYRGPSDSLAMEKNRSRQEFDDLIGRKKADTGEQAVARSNEVQRLANAGTPAGRTTGNRSYMSSNPALQEIAPQRVGSRLFYRVGEFYVESGIDVEDKENMKKVEFLSQEYLDLVKQYPELAQIFALGERVIFAWRGEVYFISSS